MVDSAPYSVIFDIGNVLVRWDPRNLYEKLIPDPDELDWFLENIVTLEWHTEHDRGRPFSEGVRRLSTRHPKHAELIAAFHHRWEETLGGTIQGSVDILEDLAAINTPLYALTNFSAETFPAFRAANAYCDHFRDILVSGEAGLVKPDPAIYRLAIARFGIDPARTLFVDDRDANIKAAETEGLRGILFESPEHLRNKLKEYELF